MFIVYFLCSIGLFSFFAVPILLGDIMFDFMGMIGITIDIMATNTGAGGGNNNNNNDNNNNNGGGIFGRRRKRRTPSEKQIHHEEEKVSDEIIEEIFGHSKESGGMLKSAFNWPQW